MTTDGDGHFAEILMVAAQHIKAAAGDHCLNRDGDAIVMAM
jgi:hypothetical protein